MRRMPVVDMTADMMAAEYVAASIDGQGLMRLQLTRPDKKNALTPVMYRKLAQLLREADENPQVRVVTLTGSGDSFCGGNDVTDFVPQQGTVPDASAAMDFLASISAIKKPVIAAVNGLAVGIGVTLLLHCDLVYAADTATFAMPFVNLGIVAEAASTQILPALLGHQRACELLLFGEPIDASRALAIGLVNEMLPLAQLAARAEERAVRLAGKPLPSVLAMKALLRRPADPVDVRMQLEAVEFVRLLQTPETRAIIEGFLRRRR
jgi:enoyl-CoA hydratase/carnithine racemase